MKELGAWAQAASMMHAVTASYAPKEEPTIDELKSELAAAQASHQHANRALTNMAVALSDRMDHVAMLQEETRKTKLEHQKTIAHLNALGDAERRLLRTAEGRVNELEQQEKRFNEDFSAQVKRTTELADMLAARSAAEETAGELLFVVTYLRHENGPRWCVAKRETDTDGSRDVIALFHEEAPARWFAERWRPDPKKETP